MPRLCPTAGCFATAVDTVEREPQAEHAPQRDLDVEQLLQRKAASARLGSGTSKLVLGSCVYRIHVVQCLDFACPYRIDETYLLFGR